MFNKQFEPMISWYTSSLEAGGYPLIALLMAIESSILPLPSEVVIPPAAHLVWNKTVPTSLAWLNGTNRVGLVIGIVIAGTLGSWLGAAIMYWTARLAGRPLVMRYGKWILVSPEKVEGAERWAAHYGSMGIFVSRLLPVVRHLIGIPAGVVRMNFWLFSLFTLLGSAVWCTVLCYVGIQAGQDKSLMEGELYGISRWLGGAMLVLGGLYYFAVHRQMKKSHG